MSTQVLRSTPERGFTLIELVVVIVILGILAAFAIPRFANIATDARASAINGMAGTLRSTAALVHGMALARNQTGATGTLTLEGSTVALVHGYPEGDTDGIQAAMVNVDTSTFNIVHAAGTTTVTVIGATTPASCSVQYVQPAAAGSPGLVQNLVTTGC